MPYSKSKSGKMKKNSYSLDKYGNQPPAANYGGYDEDRARGKGSSVKNGKFTAAGNKKLT